MALAMLSQAGLATRFWDDAVVTASFLINRIPTPILNNISPFESTARPAYTSPVPSVLSSPVQLDHFQHTPYPSQTPSSSPIPQSPPAIFPPPINYTPASASSLQNQSHSSISSPAANAPAADTPDTDNLPTDDDISAKPTHHMVTRGKASIYKPKVFTISLDCLPRSALEALLIPIWKAAMLEEFLALLRNRTWILTSLPPGKNLIGNTWIFRLKRHVDGSIARHKARLVAQGFSQEPGFDFTETFSPVVKPTTIRLILSIAVTLGWEISHLDVNNAFLHGDLNEEIYMRQPVGFEQGDPSLVCKLNKALYGLKQASRSWFLTIQSVLLSLGFQQSRADTSLFFRIRGKEVIYLLIYVDDMLVTVKEKRMSCNVMEPRVSVPTWKDVLLSGMPSLVKS
ncbi:hypothetical protein SASPL_122361 [Salvia splendens]|uniref:Reverse transcriptase Ty1/copia-type domain-containing protein n=1 Tax=Salvia splendens TaxID=180675 RepID=A0A8X8XN67_SALSN|nr:hypothetical protein SASPL_122361 [Salvia splendens]